jgi:queuine tRNA-ribosyltransferase
MMKSNNTTTLVPVLTSPAGLCLTAKNWQEVGVSIASYYLVDLLMKPGFDFLKTLPDIARYVGWHDTLVLNASLPSLSSDGFYKVRSRYDGSSKQYTPEDIWQIISSLRPTIVMLPESLIPSIPTQDWLIPESVRVIVPITERLNFSADNRTIGTYMDCVNNNKGEIELSASFFKNQEAPDYVVGELNLAQMLVLAEERVAYIESDIPAREALLGRVYCSDGVLSIDNAEFAMQCEVIEKDCLCPTCTQSFTRAYLHHLLGQTPLLCQRLLVQHNIYYCQAELNNFKKAR